MSNALIVSELFLSRRLVSFNAGTWFILIYRLPYPIVAQYFDLSPDLVVGHYLFITTEGKYTYVYRHPQSFASLNNILVANDVSFAHTPSSPSYTTRRPQPTDNLYFVVLQCVKARGICLDSPYAAAPYLEYDMFSAMRATLQKWRGMVMKELGVPEVTAVEDEAGPLGVPEVTAIEDEAGPSR